MFELTQLRFPLDIATEVQASGGIMIILRDREGNVARQQLVSSSTAEAVYAALASFRSKIDDGVATLGQALQLPADSKPAKALSWPFDGCEREKKATYDGLSEEAVGCYFILMIGAFIVLPVIGWIMLALAILLFVFYFGTALFSELSDSFERRRDRRHHFLRVVRASEVHRTDLTADHGLAVLEPTYSSSFRGKIVCFVRVSDRFVLANAELKPVRAAFSVAKEALRHRRDLEAGQQQTASEVASAQRAAERIAQREKEGLDSRTV